MAQLIESIIGHTVQIRNLKSAIAEKKLPHALIFSGPSSIGKKKTAIALAQILICENQIPDQACAVCGSCLRVEKNQSENLKIITPDGASIKAEQVRDVLDYLSLSNFGKNRVIIFDQAHLMNPTAANALLKTLEEPYPNVYFILIGPEVSNFMTTIRSRSQVIRFSALSQAQLQLIKPGLEQWIYSCSRGQIEQLDQFTSAEGQKLREDSLVMLEHFWSDQEFLLSDEWKKSIKEAQELARKEGKDLFLNFTGSDWCGWCQKLQQDVFSKPEFIQWAKKNVVLLELDFPRRKQLSPELTQQNASLQQTFQVSGYPTIWMFFLNKDEKNGKYTILPLGSLGYPTGAEQGKEEVKFLKEAGSLLEKGIKR